MGTLSGQPILVAGGASWGWLVGFVIYFHCVVFCFTDLILWKCLKNTQVSSFIFLSLPEETKYVGKSRNTSCLTKYLCHVFIDTIHLCPLLRGTFGEKKIIQIGDWDKEVRLESIILF